MKNTIRGIITNVISLGILYTLSTTLQIQKYALIALALQYFVYFIHGLPQNSEKFYDASGSLTHLALIIVSILENNTRYPRQLVTTILAVMWLTRLGSFLFSRILKDGKDGRFDYLKKNPIRFLSVWTIQALWVFLIQLPVVLINNIEGEQPTTFIDYLAWLLWTFGFFFEVIADAQKSAFKSISSNHDKYITSGLWAYSRHPNYFGEILMWVAITMSCSQMFVGYQWLVWLSPIFTTFLLLCVSGVPLLEKSGQKKWGHLENYQKYMKNTPCIIPSFFLKEQ